MVPEAVFVENMLLCHQVQHLAGSVVECGVWRGGSIAGMASILGPQRHYYLFDSFAGLPPAQPIDGPGALAWQKNASSSGYHDNCTAFPESAQAAMALALATQVHLVQGWFQDTLPAFEPAEPIALLRLDADWYESTSICLERLFPHLAPDGILILDDYGTWEGCNRATHDYLSRHSRPEHLRKFGSVTYLRKAAASHQSPS